MSAAWAMLGYSCYVVLAVALLGIISWGISCLRHPERRAAEDVDEAYEQWASEQW